MGQKVYGCMYKECCSVVMCKGRKKKCKEKNQELDWFDPRVQVLCLARVVARAKRAKTFSKRHHHHLRHLSRLLV